MTPFEGDWRPRADSEFVHQIQLDERTMMHGDDRLKAPTTEIVRYSPSLHVRDTIWNTVAPPSLPLLGGNFAFQQPAYVQRPLGTTGAGWWAHAPPDSSYIDVQYNDGRALRVDLHSSANRPSLKTLKRKHAEWYIAESVIRYSPQKHQQRIQSLSW